MKREYVDNCFPTLFETSLLLFVEIRCIIPWITSFGGGFMASSAQKQDLTKGSLWPKIFLFSVPLVFSNLLQVVFNLADIAVVGQFVGSLALGSVGSTTILISMFTGFFIGLSGGINVLTARHYGARSTQALQDTIHTAALVSLALGAVMTALGLGASRWVLTILGTKAELLEGALLYLRIYLLGMPALALYNFGNAVFSAVGDPQRPVRYLTISGILNVVLNLFFVLVCGLEVSGVALASIISQYLSAFLVVRDLFLVKSDYAMGFDRLRLHRSRAVEILAIGLPGGLQNCIFAVANLFTQSAINTFDAITVAGISAAANADTIIYDVMAAFYTACGSFMGQNYGARKKNRILKSYLICLLYSFAIGTGLGLLLVCFGSTFLRLFTSDPAVVTAGMTRLTIMGFCYGFSAFMDNSIAGSRALGKSLAPSIIVILGSCVFRIVWIKTIFAHFGTIPSLFSLYIASWALTGLAELLYFARTYRKQTGNW